MAQYYPTDACGNGSQTPYSCNPCPVKEYARVRSIAFVKTSYVSTLILSASSTSAWATAVASGNAIVIWKTKGSYDGGTTSTGPGFGDEVETNGNTTHTLTFEDPNYTNNCDFYNDVRQEGVYSVVYRTSSSIHFSIAPVSISPKNPVADDLNAFVVWSAVLKWIYPDSPCPYPTPANVFSTCTITQ